VSQVEALELILQRGEFTKMQYLVNVIRCVDEALQSFKPWKFGTLMEEGVATEFVVDWRSIAIHCMPQVVIVMNHDKTGKEYYDHPQYAILAYSGQVISLDREIHLSVEEGSDAKAEADVNGSLNSLLTYAQSIDGGKRDNALRLIRQLQRVLK
jgi:hypothetical protein